MERLSEVVLDLRRKNKEMAADSTVAKEEEEIMEASSLKPDTTISQGRRNEGFFLLPLVS